MTVAVICPALRIGRRLLLLGLLLWLPANANDYELGRLYKSQEHKSVQVGGEGVVIKILEDVNVGSRHQRFIVRLKSGQMLLIAHNIDLAPRVTGLAEGDEVEFYGEYEWNIKGGVIHWTHRDPRGAHVAGWIRHGGMTYQ
ncbi:DUF3465 domain-containing protein [Teredinibacter turnerae]|uniref:DUF3465 domain-containing protein n=1 Tax=Teredinibacter turnerae TaxID=2426 RepID=UPI00036BF304|nr:DUF3465 domain-containing protein [Teredinibacter turnerae]